MGRYVRWLSLAIVAFVSVLVMFPAGAQAHSILIGSSPSDGAQLANAPSAVSFTFNEDLLSYTDTISINDDAGKNLFSTPVHPSGPTVSIPWPSGLRSGTFQVAYRVASADGHPVSGAVMFTIGARNVAPNTSASAAGSRPSVWLWVLVAAIVALLLAVIALVIVNAKERPTPSE